MLPALALVFAAGWTVASAAPPKGRVTIDLLAVAGGNAAKPTERGAQAYSPVIFRSYNWLRAARLGAAMLVDESLVRQTQVAWFCPEVSKQLGPDAITMNVMLQSGEYFAAKLQSGEYLAAKINGDAVVSRSQKLRGRSFKFNLNSWINPDLLRDQIGVITSQPRNDEACKKVITWGTRDVDWNTPTTKRAFDSLYSSDVFTTLKDASR